MNSRILLIAFATISYIGVTKSAGVSSRVSDVDLKSISQPSETSTPLSNHTEVVNQVPQKTHPNETINIEYHDSTVPTHSSTTTSKPATTTTTTTTTTSSINTTTVQPNSTSVPTTAKTVSTTTSSTTSTTTTTSSSSTTNSTPTGTSTTAFPSSIVTTPTFKSSTSSIPEQNRQFDGPSFIGGIVLTVGLTAIGFIAFKFYKAGKLDMNYRTL